MPDACIGIILSDNQAMAQEAMDCVLGQSGVDLELVLLEGGEGHGTPQLSDSRVRLFKRSSRLTQFQFLELMASESAAPYLLCLEAHQHLLPNTLSSILADMKHDEHIEMTYTLQFAADVAGHVSRAEYHLQWDKARKLAEFDPGRVESFLTLDFLPNTIRVYRREALRTKIFCRPKKYSQYGFIWSVHCLLNAKLKPEPVCISKGILPFTSGSSLDAKDYLRRVAVLLRYRTHVQANFSSGEAFLCALGYVWLNSAVVNAWNSCREAIWAWQVRSGLLTRRYWFFVRLFSHWPLPGSPAKKAAARESRKKIGYYIWQYPVRSQTFVQREVAALQKAGQNVVVVTEIAAEHDFISELKTLLAGSVINNQATVEDHHTLFGWRMFLGAPLRFLRLKLFVLGRRYHPNKNRRLDKALFKTAMRLARLAQEHGIEHLHSPWADYCAFVVLIASRLLGIPYSLQARAHDIHRQNYQFGLEDKFLGADFIVTNTRYNVGQIQSVVGKVHAGKIKHIYNGLNIRQFRPERPRNPDADELRLLCVARLIDQKGLTYLLQACRQLLDSGLKIHCDIVGGFEDIFMNYYIGLKRLHQALALESTVHFAGSLPFEEVLNYYQKADVFVLPCVIAQDGSRDIIPNAVLEAMAMQLPVVSTAVTGLPEMVDDGKSGFLVPPHDFEALVSAIERLARSASLRSEFGLAGRKKVEQQFDSDINVARYQELFNNPGNSLSLEFEAGKA